MVGVFWEKVRVVLRNNATRAMVKCFMIGLRRIESIQACCVGVKPYFAPLGLVCFRLSHGLRRGLHSCAAMRLTDSRQMPALRILLWGGDSVLPV